MSARVIAPHVYRAISAVTEALANSGGIPKTHTNLRDQYQYRSIDDVMANLAPLLAKHRLCVLPRAVKRDCLEGRGENNAVLFHVHLQVAYDLVSSRDGSGHTIKAFGEALDVSDKATAKAMSAAYKTAMLQTFCIPAGSEETESSSHRKKLAIAAEPVQGWKAWAEDIILIIRSCESREALDRMRSGQAQLLTAISRERTELYKQIGEAFAGRADDLARPEAEIGKVTALGLSLGGSQGAIAKPQTVDA